MIGYYDPAMSLRGQINNGTISGRITDNNNQPITGVTVAVKGQKTGTLSDENGFFKQPVKIQLAPGHFHEIAAPPGTTKHRFTDSTNLTSSRVRG